jgi:hypothetical protein
VKVMVSFSNRSPPPLEKAGQPTIYRVPSR